MSSATQTDISPNLEVGQSQDSSEKRPEVVIRIRKTETKDESNKGSTNIELLEALDALEPYQNQDNGDHPVTKCGSRILRTPVFHSSHDESMSGEDESNGNQIRLPKGSIRQEESEIVGAMAKWVSRIQHQENELKWSVLISPHLYADLNLAVKEHVIVYDSLQVFFTGEHLPTFILTLYDLTKSSETTKTTTVEGKRETTADEKAHSSKTTTTTEGSARKFTLQLATELTVELHKFCCVDFLLLPCAMTYKAFVDDFLHNKTSAAGTALQRQIEQEQRKAQWYYSGPLQLSKSGYREVKEATILVAGVSYVPYIMRTEQKQNAKNKVWLLKLNPKWRRALSLLTEVLGSTGDATYTLTCRADKYQTVEMTVLEAARRWAFSHDVILSAPTHSGLSFEKTKKDLLHLTGKRKHTRYRMEIKTMDDSADPGLECGRYRGKSEAAHLRKRADVLTSEGGRHVRRVYIGAVQVKIELPTVMEEDEDEEDEDEEDEDEEHASTGLSALPETTPAQKIADWKTDSSIKPDPESDQGHKSETSSDAVTEGGSSPHGDSTTRDESGKQNQTMLLSAAAKLTKYSKTNYENMGNNAGMSAPVLQNRRSKGLLKKRDNQLQKTSIKAYERKLCTVLHKYPRSTKFAVWMSTHLHVDFNLPLEVKMTDPVCLHAFILGINLPPMVLTLYDSSSESKLCKTNAAKMKKTCEELSRLLSDNLNQRLSQVRGQTVTILPCAMSMEELTGDALQQQFDKQEDVRPLNKDDYRQTSKIAASLVAISAVPYILQKDTQADENKQKWYILMESAWRDVLTLMIEALSFKNGECYIPYIKDAEFKVKVAALETARRWSLSENVACVLDDSNNADIKAHMSNLEAPLGSGLMRLTMSDRTEQENLPAKRMFLDTNRIPEHLKVMYTSQFREARDSGCGSSTASSISSVSSDHLDYKEREFLNAWFPHLESESYIVPPAHIDTVYERMAYIEGGEQIQVLKTQQQIDRDESREVRDTVCRDKVLKNVHHCMNQIKNKAARENEIMVILIQAKFGVYGADTQSIYTGAAARNLSSHEAEPLNLKEDFVDLVVIHRERGIMMAAIIPQTEDDPLAVQEELKKAAAYLRQARGVVRRSVLCDLAQQPEIYQAIVLPDTTRHCLEEVLKNMSNLQELQEGLSVEPGRNVSQVCLCQDDMADQTMLNAWWKASFEWNEGGDPAMDTATYAQLVARFAIPLTTVELFLCREPRLQLWTQGHLVRAVGMEHERPMSSIALFPQQFQVLEEPPDDDDDEVRILWGPTGTSKTVVLILKGNVLLRNGCGTVFVLQTSGDGAAAAYLVGHQLRQTAGQGSGSVQLVNMAEVLDEDGDWTEEGKKKVQALVEALCQHALTYGRVHILADEADCNVIAEIYRALKQRHVRFTLWAAGTKLDVPADMERYVRYLTQPLRSTPVVVREVEQADDMKDGTVPAYTRPPVSAPCDGPPVMTVGHYADWYRGDRQGHEGDYPWRCARCGEIVGDILTQLRVGYHDHAPHGQGGLTFNDVFVLGDMGCDTDRPDDHLLSPAPFIRGLNSRGVPTRKVAHNDTAAVRQLAEMTSSPTQRAAGRGPDEAVTVANQNTVWGLERHVVVYLDSMYGHGDAANATGRLRSISRSTAQVIWVKNVRT